MRGECFLGLILFLVTTVATADESFPYKVAVQARDVTVRSGPGSQFYATGHVAAGDEIEVYQRKGGGWLAIRPPAASFNWVEANKLRMTNDPDLAKVVGNNAVAWVGSELGAVEDHKWQIKLDAGESVQLMSRQSMAIFSGDERRDFYQIAPPAGDFRWVLERDIEPLVERAATVESPSEIQLAQFQVVADQTNDASTSRDGFVPRDDSAAETPAERVASIAPRESFRPSEPGRADFDTLAKMLNLDLSETVSKEPAQWKLTSLHQDAAALLEQSDTTLQRGKARLLLEQIKEFESLQRRYAGTEDSGAVTPQAESQPAGEPPASELAAVPSSSGFDPRFDGRGWLLPVHSSRQASPPYALLDQQGQILTFVSPAPGLNLHRYLRKEVGIFGQRSRAEFLNKPHFTADRIVDMERHRR
jgi:hypothetical protein